MQDVSIDRLSLVPGGLIFYGMKKAIDMETKLYRNPTPAELYAIEQRARLERARVIAAALKSVYERAASAFSAKVVRHA